jgi:hypothetical protein
MMAELGGPLPRNGIEAKLDTDVRKTRADDYWVSMIVPDLAGPDIVAGTVGLWSHDDGDDAGLSEIGWMVMPEFRVRGTPNAEIPIRRRGRTHPGRRCRPVNGNSAQICGRESAVPVSLRPAILCALRRAGAAACTRSTEQDDLVRDPSQKHGCAHKVTPARRSSANPVAPG